MTTLDPIQVFRTEAAELFEQIEIGLLDLMEDLSNQNQIDAVFRGLHTLKGSGAMFGFEALAAFTHHLETTFEQVRKGDVPATRELIGVVLEAQDHMRTLVDHPPIARRTWAMRFWQSCTARSVNIMSQQEL
jgi:two-component system chemotaxis sensor kinase CheA